VGQTSATFVAKRREPIPHFVSGALVSSPADVRKALAEATSGGKKTVLMRVKSGQNTRFVAVPLGRG
ncbi:hypothetical protein CH340_12100, partial [Rhodoplanes serenus]